MPPLLFSDETTESKSGSRCFPTRPQPSKTIAVRCGNHIPVSPVTAAGFGLLLFNYGQQEVPISTSSV